MPPPAHGEQGVREPTHLVGARAERYRQTRLEARRQPQGEVFATAVLGESRPRHRSGDASPINPYVVGAAAPVAGPPVLPRQRFDDGVPEIPAAEFEREHRRSVGAARVALARGKRPAAVPSYQPDPRPGVRTSKGGGRPVETNDGREPHLCYRTLSEAAAAVDVKPSRMFRAIQSGQFCGGRTWRYAEVHPA